MILAVSRQCEQSLPSCAAAAHTESDACTNWSTALTVHRSYKFRLPAESASTLYADVPKGDVTRIEGQEWQNIYTGS